MCSLKINKCRSKDRPWKEDCQVTSPGPALRLEQMFLAMPPPTAGEGPRSPGASPQMESLRLGAAEERQSEGTGEF